MMINQDILIISELIKIKDKLDKIYNKNLQNDKLLNIITQLQGFINVLKED